MERARLEVPEKCPQDPVPLVAPRRAADSLGEDHEAARAPDPPDEVEVREPLPLPEAAEPLVRLAADEDRLVPERPEPQAVPDVGKERDDPEHRLPGVEPEAERASE